MGSLLSAEHTALTTSRRSGNARHTPIAQLRSTLWLIRSSVWTTHTTIQRTPLIRLTSQRFLQNKGANRFIFHNSVFYISQFKPCLELKIVCFAQIMVMGFFLLLRWKCRRSQRMQSTIVCKIKWNIRFYFVYCIV